MSDKRCYRFRVASMEELEFDVEPNEETIMRLLLTSRKGDRIAVEIPHEMWTQIFQALTLTMKKFAPKGLQQ